MLPVCTGNGKVCVNTLCMLSAPTETFSVTMSSFSSGCSEHSVSLFFYTLDLDDVTEREETQRTCLREQPIRKEPA